MSLLSQFVHISVNSAFLYSCSSLFKVLLCLIEADFVNLSVHLLDFFLKTGSFLLGLFASHYFSIFCCNFGPHTGCFYSLQSFCDSFVSLWSFYPSCVSLWLINASLWLVYIYMFKMSFVLFWSI